MKLAIVPLTDRQVSMLSDTASIVAESDIVPISTRAVLMLLMAYGNTHNPDCDLDVINVFPVALNGVRVALFMRNDARDIGIAEQGQWVDIAVRLASYGIRD